MATLIELRNFANDSVLRNKIQAAIAINLETVLSGQDNVPPYSQGTGAHDVRLTWANGSLGDLSSNVQKFMELVLAKNSTVTAIQMQSAIDGNQEADNDPIADKVAESVDLVAGVTT